MISLNLKKKPNKSKIKIFTSEGILEQQSLQGGPIRMCVNILLCCNISRVSNRLFIYVCNVSVSLFRLEPHYSLTLSYHF